MNSRRPMPDMSTDPCAATGSGGRNLCYIAPAPQTDVMFDQLEYLLAHSRGGCPAGCAECARLHQIKLWLLRPFLVGTKHRRPKRAAAA